RAGDDTFEKPQHAAHLSVAIERGDKMHLRRAGIGETCVDLMCQQGLDQDFRTVHDSVVLPHFDWQARASIPTHQEYALPRLTCQDRESRYLLRTRTIDGAEPTLSAAGAGRWPWRTLFGHARSTWNSYMRQRSRKPSGNPSPERNIIGLVSY